jgi:putative phage-type endonuclease
MNATFASAELVGYFEPGSPDWHAARAHGIGGSEVAALLGISPYDSPFSLWHRKAGRVALDDVDVPVMEWGRRLEPVVCQKYQENHPDYRLVAAGTYRHRARPWQIANPDRLIHTADDQGDTPHGLVEAKTAYSDDAWGEPGTDEIPVHYRAQCLWYMDTLDRPWVDVAVLIAGSDYREYRVHYDQAEADLIRGRAEEFWTTVTAGRAPLLDAADATLRTVRALHPRIDDVSVEISADLALAYGDVCAAYRDAKTAKQAVVIQLLDAMGDARTATCLGQRVAIRVPNGVHSPALRPASDLMKEIAA